MRVVCFDEYLGPTPVYHRDIRPPNMVIKYDDNTWFRSDVATLPTRPAILVEDGHSPRVHEPSHGVKVEILGVSCIV